MLSFVLFGGGAFFWFPVLGGVFVWLGCLVGCCIFLLLRVGCFLFFWLVLVVWVCVCVFVFSVCLVFSCVGAGGLLCGLVGIDVLGCLGLVSVW